jgi:uncharacterized CHY-type Zn-finger protein
MAFMDWTRAGKARLERRVVERAEESGAVQKLLGPMAPNSKTMRGEPCPSCLQQLDKHTDTHSRQLEDIAGCCVSVSKTWLSCYHCPSDRQSHTMRMYHSTTAVSSKRLDMQNCTKDGQKRWLRNISCGENGTVDILRHVHSGQKQRRRSYRVR